MAFWKPGTVAPGSSIDRESEKEEGQAVTAQYNANANASLSEQRLRLPIYKNRKQILYLVEKYQVVVVVGQTGSGKTTQVPQYLHEAGWTAQGHVVACTQPRRVAATTVATRVADEMGVVLGQQVGYTIRFDDCSDSTTTRIKYMTDGMLFRETLLDPLLTKYSVIMIDEAHERTLYTDILVGTLKKILKKRPELRVIISSATLDAEAFYDFFNTNTTEDVMQDNAVIMSMEGRMFPVDICYLQEPSSNYLTTVVETVFKIHEKEPAGDVLVFLTGRDEIDTAISLINERAHTYGPTHQISALPLYGGLTFEEQLAAFEPPERGTRKVVVSTNIAEASVTIDGIVYVVDAGFVKLRAYNPKTDMESLMVSTISQASAQQRAGRAGRTRPGKAFRLYTEAAFNNLPTNGIPEMQRSNLAPLVLQLKALGIENVLYFDFVSPPPVSNLTKALELLYSLGALDDYGRLTMPFGMHLAEFPVDPLLATMLLNSLKMKCAEDMLTIAAMLSVQSVFVGGDGQRREAEEERRKFAVEEGDHITYLNVYNAFLRHNRSPKWCYHHLLNHKSLQRAVAVRAQLRKYLARFGMPIESANGDIDVIRKCIVSGYFSHAAKLRPDGSYGTVLHNEILHIHPNSVLFRRSPAWVVFHEVVETTKPFMRDLTVIEPDWLTELAPHFYERKTVAPSGR
ncbi:P-loop containing nucleoside triphosphate hydrolase protein [Fimicolochytrium jonesii]|uniref:P-loop containing nucleoside triphosphate hydrolase protein n=1 Tax=Fimicolochytrium jonesii TaxID=1396493 RepID=UPI0022FEFD4A|nr:P-loop containing nucleoside triphosphate hydrolase protein [Fimicolochytrium jonesii]KAI8825220.1 P-loop containing nucleoside triphosphate hydrolase protein [Fimicolochytrium jonesii]